MARAVRRPRCPWRDCLRHGWRGQTYKDVFTACPAKGTGDAGPSTSWRTRVWRLYVYALQATYPALEGGLVQGAGREGVVGDVGFVVAPGPAAVDLHRDADARQAAGQFLAADLHVHSIGGGFAAGVEGAEREPEVECVQAGGCAGAVGQDDYPRVVAQLAGAWGGLAFRNRRVFVPGLAPEVVSTLQGFGQAVGDDAAPVQQLRIR